MTDATADEVAVRAVMAAWAQALRDKNAAGVTACQADGMVLYGLAPPLVSGASARWLQAWFDTWDGPIGYAFADLTVAVGGDIAFSHGLSHMTGTKTDGEVVDLWFRFTLGLRRRNGGWKVVHEHESVPFLMDGSFKAAIDLKP
jgi:PhnB protein